MIYKLFSSQSTWLSRTSVPNIIKIGLLYTTFRTRNNFTSRKFDVILYSGPVKWMAFIKEIARRCRVNKRLFTKFYSFCKVEKDRHYSISVASTWVHNFGTTTQKFCASGCFLKSLLCWKLSTNRFNLKYIVFLESALLPSSGHWLLLL